MSKDAILNALTKRPDPKVLDNGEVVLADGSRLPSVAAYEARMREVRAEHVQAHQEFLQRQASEQAQAAYATRQMKSQQRELLDRNRQSFDQATGNAPYVDPIEAKKRAYRERYGIS